MLKAVRLGALTFDKARACLSGPAGPVVLRRKSYEVLEYLVDNPERVVSIEELLEAVWPDVTVGDNSVAQCVIEIRRALGPTGRDVVRTVPRRGYQLNLPAGSPDSTTQHDTQTPSPLHVPERPSIAVLSFANLSGDPGQEYFSDCIAEDIITELSRFSELLVIARNSSFQYKARHVDVRQIGKELGARYVLEGSSRLDSNRIRVTAQLIDATTGTHLWAERYDRELNEALAVPDEVVRAIVAILAAHVNKAEAERTLLKPPATWQAHDWYMRGAVKFANYRSSYNIPLLYEARDLLQRSIFADPNYARPHALFAASYLNAYLNAVDGDYRNPVALERAYELARKAVQLDPNLPIGHAILGDVLGFKQRFEESLAEFEKALELNPNFSYFQYAMVLVMAGDPLRAIEVVKAHTRLDPFYEPLAPFMLGMAFYMLERYAEAVVSLRETVLRAPRFIQGHLWLAATYAQMGFLDESQAQAAEALSIFPSYTVPTALPFRRRADVEHLLQGLRKAGLPEKLS